MTREEILAMEPGPAMDDVVHELVMGGCCHGSWREVDINLDPLVGPYRMMECTKGCGAHVGVGIGQNAVLDFGRPEYSTDIACAFQVAEKLAGHDDADEQPFILTRQYSANAGPAAAQGMWLALFMDGIRYGDPGVPGAAVTLGHRAEAYAPTAPLAICRAALLVYAS